MDVASYPGQLRWEQHLLRRVSRHVGRTIRPRSGEAASAPPPATSPLFLSMLEPTRAARGLALGVVLVLVALFVAAAPFARMPLVPVFAFIPIYESALVICDLITVILLVGQYTILRSRGLLLLASAYLFTACLTVAHALTFPGLFAPAGLLGAGAQSTAWLYVFWHAGFPVLVMAYAWVGDSRVASEIDRRRSITPLTLSFLLVGVVALALTLLATEGHAWLPPVMIGNQKAPAMNGVFVGVWALSLVAFAVLWRRSRRSLLDVWLLVVMCAWICDIALAAVLNHGRFDLGFYAGRIYGWLAATFVLVVLLLENGRLCAGLVAAHERARDEYERGQQAEAAAVSANRAKSEFLSRMSHELQIGRASCRERV